MHLWVLRCVFVSLFYQLIELAMDARTDAGFVPSLVVTRWTDAVGEEDIDEV